MRLDLLPIIEQARKLIAAIEAKSWHHSVNAAHACLCAMPSPAWAEDEPGIAKYYFAEADANRSLNLLRGNVALWLYQLVGPLRSWEVSDEWPAPAGIARAVAGLERFVPEGAECSPS